MIQVIAAEGEHKASRALRHAAEIISDCPAALQVLNFVNIDISKIYISVTVPTDSEQYICWKQQHYCVSSTNWSSVSTRPFIKSVVEVNSWNVTLFYVSNTKNWLLSLKPNKILCKHLVLKETDSHLFYVHHKPVTASRLWRKIRNFNGKMVENALQAC